MTPSSGTAGEPAERSSGDGPDSDGPDSDGPASEAEHVRDDRLVAQARTGDRAALETLLRLHHHRIHQLCRSMCADRGDAEDATQEALVAIVRGLARFDGRSRFTTWSYRVATNACLDQLRRRARRPVPTEVDDRGRPGVAHQGTVHDGALRAVSNRDGAARDDGAGSDPADQLVAAERRTRLQAALAELPETFRVPVVLRDVAQLDYAEIAELLDLAPGTVRSRIARGRARLAAALPDLQPPGNQGSAADVGTHDA